MVVYLKDGLNQNSYELEYIYSRISKLNWLIIKNNVSVADILNNINSFNETRIKNIWQKK